MNSQPLSISKGKLATLMKFIFLNSGIIYFFEYYSIFLEKSSVFPLRNISDFWEIEFYDEFFNRTLILFYLIMFIVFFLILDIITILQKMFPSFGVHFLALSKAGQDLMMLFLIILITLLGFAVWSNSMNGSVYVKFNSFTNSIIYLLANVKLVLKIIIFIF